MDQAERLRSMVSNTVKTNSNARVITVTSGKGGVGKTSLSLNLAIYLQKAGKKVVIIDADFGLANIEVMLGVHPKYNISDLIYKDMDIEDVVTKGPFDIGFISGGSGVAEMVSLGKEEIKTFVTKIIKLDTLADVIIIDTGAGISDAVQEFVLCSPEVLLVMTPEPTSTMDAYALLKTLNRRKEFVSEDKSIKVIANRVTKENEGSALYNNINIVSSQFLNIELEYLGAVIQDNCLQKAVIQQEPVLISYPNNSAAKCIEKIASKLIDAYDETKENKNGFAALFINMLKAKRSR